MGFTVQKGSEKGSQKAVSRRCLGPPLGEYALLGARPTYVLFVSLLIVAFFADSGFSENQENDEFL